MRRADDTARKGVRRRAGWLLAAGVAAVVLGGCPSGSSNIELTEDNVNDALLADDEIPFGEDWSGEDDEISDDQLEYDLYEVDREECERSKADSVEAEFGVIASYATAAYQETADGGIALYEAIWVFEDGDVAEEMMEGIIAENSGRVECEDGIETVGDDDEGGVASPVPDGVPVEKGTHCQDKADRYACYEYETTDDNGIDVTNFDTYLRVGDAVVGLFVVDYDGDVDDDDLEELTDAAIEKVRTGEELETDGS